MIPGVFAPLAAIEKVELHSLQTTASGTPLKDHSPMLTDFTETAALISNLDLVISVDTAVAHLAGALGKPVWLLLAFAPDWRWLLDRSDSPWYPTARLFRQQPIGDWTSVIQNICRELSSFRHDLKR
jgi:ADP-heptose:LPS heptosyltransferase